MKFHMTFLIALIFLATSTQGLHLKSAIKKKLPSLKGLTSSLTQALQSASSAVSSSSTSSSSTSLSSESNVTQVGSAEVDVSLNEPLPSVTLYSYPPQQQIIYRTIRPVVRRTFYVQTPSVERGIQDIIGNLIPSPISGGLAGLKSIIGNAIRGQTVTQSVTSIQDVQAPAVPAIPSALPVIQELPALPAVPAIQAPSVLPYPSQQGYYVF